MSSFSDEVVRQSWGRSGGRCECLKNHSWHSWGRCPQRLIWNDRRKEKKRKLVGYLIAKSYKKKEVQKPCQTVKFFVEDV